MKYLKRFNESKSHDYDFILNGSYTINNGMMDVDGSVILDEFNLTHIQDVFSPYNTIGNIVIYDSFGNVSEDFICCNNKLTSLKGSPSIVGGEFNCANNKLDKLEYCPKEIGGSFICASNNLTSLEGCPIKVRHINCSNNNILDFYGIGEFNTIDCKFNPVHELYKLCPTRFIDTESGLLINEFIKYLNEFRPIRGNKILGKRLEECLYMCDIELDVTTLTFENYTLLE